jgi:hypothetical protein
LWGGSGSASIGLETRCVGGGKARKTQVRQGAHIERGERLTGSDWRAFFALFGTIAALPLVIGIVGGGIKYGFSNIFWGSWRTMVSFLGASVVFLAVNISIILIPHRRVDREGISLIVDEDGIYLGRSRPLRIDWPDIAEVALLTYHIPPTRPFTRKTMAYYVALRLNGAKAKRNPLRWRPRQRCQDGVSFSEIEAAVMRYAPSVPVISRTLGSTPSGKQNRPHPAPPEPRAPGTPRAAASQRREQPRQPREPTSAVRPIPRPPTSFTPRTHTAVTPRWQVPPARRPRRSGRR